MKDNRCRPGEKYIFSSPDGAFRAIATKMSDACQGHTSISVEIFSQIRSAVLKEIIPDRQRMTNSQLNIPSVIMGEILMWTWLFKFLEL